MEIDFDEMSDVLKTMRNLHVHHCESYEDISRTFMTRDGCSEATYLWKAAFPPAV